MKPRLLLTLLATHAILPAAAYDFRTDDGLCYNRNSDGTSVTVTYEQNRSMPYNSAVGGSLSIPASVTHDGITFKVTAIGDQAFCGCINLTSVTIPNSVTSIDVSAFSHCYGLTSVSIPNSVTSIGDQAFYACSLMSVTIPNSVTAIGGWAFEGCRGLTSVTIGNSVISIGDRAFQDCINLAVLTWNAVNCAGRGNMPTDNIERVIIGDKVEMLPPNFVVNSKITTVTIPNSVISIGEYAFSSCTGLTRVTIGNSVTAIGNSAFSSCTGLTSVTIPNSVTSIGGYAFYNCTGLTSVAMGNSVEAIGDYAFCNCRELRSIVLPNTLTTVGQRAFAECNHLNKLVIGENVANVGEKAFAAPALTDVVVLRPRPIVIPENTFEGVSMVGCDLHVKKNSKMRYELQDVWKDFMFILEDADEYAAGGSGSGGSSGVKGDVDGNGMVNGSDVTALYDILLNQ